MNEALLHWGRLTLATFLMGCNFLCLFPCTLLSAESVSFSPIDPYGLSPHWKWKTLESQHFQFTFPIELKPIASQTLTYLEEAHTLLSPIFQWTPSRPTQVLLIDNADAANGLTSAIGRFGMILWATPPDSWMSTAFYEDWMRLLVIHEYTHFLNMDTTHSYWNTLRILFGPLLLPNAFWPSWMLEGLAVFMETKWTSSGRGRSSFYEMILRAAVAEQKLNASEFITLDKVNGPNPYFPAGETPYLFGYELMQEATHLSQKTNRSDADILGQLSSQSADKIPFFVDHLAENSLGKTWSELWFTWVQKTKQRISKDLAQLHQYPTTPWTEITSTEPHSSTQVTGSAASPDGQWVAYTATTTQRRSGLYLQHLPTGQVRRLDDKWLGVGMKFTSDSRALIYSVVERKSLYSLSSDLKIYSLTSNTHQYLTHEARVQDPDLSRDGHWVTFTWRAPGITGLGRASLTKHPNQEWELGPIEKLYSPPMYGHVSNPQFSADGKSILFALHPPGKNQVDLMSWEVDSQQLRTLVSNGAYNRFPVVNGRGDLLFVSNQTGVDNLYLWKEGQTPQLRTHLTTGLLFPACVPHPKSSDCYASVYSTEGIKLAQFHFLSQDKMPAIEAITLNPPPAPALPRILSHDAPEIPTPFTSHTLSQRPPTNFGPEKDYSIFPSILPRLWSPILEIDAGGVGLGGEIYGFDAVNQHRYGLAASWSSPFNLLDGMATYSNRSSDLEIQISGSILTTQLSWMPFNRQYTRQQDVSTTVTYPILSTYSSLLASLGFDWQGQRGFAAVDSPQFSQKFSTHLLNIDALLTFSNAETSALAITTERGRSMRGGVRRSIDDASNTQWKFLFVGQENFPIGPHLTLQPKLRTLWTSQTVPLLTSPHVFTQGRISERLVHVFPTDDFNQLAIRGYPMRGWVSQGSTVLSLDFFFPLLRIFRGWHLYPLFFENLYGFTFIEASHLWASGKSLTLPSLGAGIRMKTALSYLPTTFSAEFHRGLNSAHGGASDFFLQLFFTMAQF